MYSTGHVLCFRILPVPCPVTRISWIFVCQSTLTPLVDCVQASLQFCSLLQSQTCQIRIQLQILMSYVMALNSCASVILTFKFFSRITRYWRNLYDTQICAPVFKNLWSLITTWCNAKNLQLGEAPWRWCQ